MDVNITAVQQNENKALPQYTQFYEVRNEGTSDILSARFSIVWPTHTPEGYAITELTAQPTVIEGNAVCDPVPIAGLGSKTTTGVNINCVTETKLTRNKRVVIRVSARVSSEALLQVFSTI